MERVGHRVRGVLVAFVLVVASAGFVPPAAADPAYGEYHPVTAVRILDTRTGLGHGHAGPLFGGNHFGVPVSFAGVSPRAVESVVVNVTVTNVTGPGFVTLWPHDQTEPFAANLNVTTGDTKGVLVSVVLGLGDKIEFGFAANATAKLDLIADVEGWYGAEGGTPGGLYSPQTPTRVADTRNAAFGPVAPLPAGATTIVAVAPAGSHVSAAMLNVTVPLARSTGFLTLWAGGARPLTSNLNVMARLTMGNAAIVPVAPDGTISVYSSQVNDVVIDLIGTFDDGTIGGWRYFPLTASRIVDTRNGTGGHSGPLTGGSTTSFTAEGVGGVPASGVEAVVATVIAVGCTSPMYMTAFRDGDTRPPTATLNCTPGHVVNNLAAPELSDTGAFDVYTSAGTTDLVVDVSGYYGGSAVS
jgi:hypothetical protein